MVRGRERSRSGEGRETCLIGLKARSRVRGSG